MGWRRSGASKPSMIITTGCAALVTSVLSETAFHLDRVIHLFTFVHVPCVDIICIGSKAGNVLDAFNMEGDSGYGSLAGSFWP